MTEKLQTPNSKLQGSSADFQSAVSQNCILRTVRTLSRVRNVEAFAECNSAIQQIANLRYAFFLRIMEPATPQTPAAPAPSKAKVFLRRLTSTIILWTI